MVYLDSYDLIVIGSGAGMNVAGSALEQGLKVALVEKGPLGGTCLNRGCIPSKIMIYPADVIRLLQDATAVGVNAKIERVDFDLIMKRMWDAVLEDRHHMEEAVKQDPNVTLYHDVGYFVSDYTMQVKGEIFSAKKIVIASGARPIIPEIPGLSDAGYLTSETVFSIKKQPASLVIIGGGYIAAELGHFFSSIGTEITIVGRNPELVPHEEPEVSALLKRKMSEKMLVLTNSEPVSVKSDGGSKLVTIRDRVSGKLFDVSVEEVLVAAGIRSNADLLRVERTGVEVDAKGWIKVNTYLETSKKNIWALGDAIGRYQYRHTANYESEVVAQNALFNMHVTVDEHAVPHAIFAYPQIGSVGLTEAEAGKSRQIYVGIGLYADVAKGYAMAEKDGFVKVVVDAETQKILGAHVIGPEAAVLVQQIVYLMNAGDEDYTPLARAQTIHPALSEAVVAAFGNLRPANFEPQEHRHHHHSEVDESST
ncbi:MAG: dihydrolipoyl dehydrogenase [Thaumarchaeota archaeon]|nr:dihydrolipoyl dehydrogenase [Nitrososphaerota archaeon]